jgi:hypothetical protein
MLDIITDINKKCISTMSADHLKTGVEPTPKMSHVSYIPQTLDSVQCDVPITPHLCSYLLPHLSC